MKFNMKRNLKTTFVRRTCYPSPPEIREIFVLQISQKLSTLPSLKYCFSFVLNLSTLKLCKHANESCVSQISKKERILSNNNKVHIFQQACVHSQAEVRIFISNHKVELLISYKMIPNLLKSVETARNDSKK